MCGHRERDCHDLRQGTWWGEGCLRGLEERQVRCPPVLFDPTLQAMHSVTFTGPLSLQEGRKAWLTAETCCSCSQAVHKRTHTHRERERINTWLEIAVSLYISARTSSHPAGAELFYGGSIQITTGLATCDLPIGTVSFGVLHSASAEGNVSHWSWWLPSRVWGVKSCKGGAERLKKKCDGGLTAVRTARDAGCRAGVLFSFLAPSRRRDDEIAETQVWCQAMQTRLQAHLPGC